MSRSKKTKAAPRLVGKRPSKRQLRLQIEVLQGGASLVSVQMPVRHRGSLALTTHGSGPLTLPHYPLPDGRLEFIEFSRAGAALVVAHDWEGFCTSKGELLTLSRGGTRRKVALTPGDYASITEGDIRIMLKLAPVASAGFGLRSGTARAYRRPFFAHFLPTKRDWQLTLIGGVAAAVIFGCGIFGLLGRTYQKATRFSDIGEDYILPFIAPEHFKQAPEALQQHLDRAHPVLSVMAYYHSFTAALMGWRHFDRSLLFPSTLDLYQELHTAAHQTLAAKVDRQQEVDRLQMMKAATSVLSIPAVQGESTEGSMRRVIDKIGILQIGLRQSLAQKRAIMTVFPHDPDYAWEEYKNVRPPNEEAEAKIAQIKPFTQASDEDLMYEEAAAMATRAAVKQRKIFARQPSDSLDEAAMKLPIGLDAGLRFASFVVDMDYRLADEKMAQLQGSEYGHSRGPARVQEPLVGEIEPALIERFLRENRFQLQLCYELALRRNEGAAGTMEWRWRIDSRGLISDVALLNSSIKDPRMTECVRQKISAWRFPRPRRGSVEISYPFEFAPSKG